MNKREKFNLTQDSIKLDPHAARHMANEVIDRTLRERKCWVCELGFETTQQKDNAQVMMVDKRVRFVHLECKSEAMKKLGNV